MASQQAVGLLNGLPDYSVLTRWLNARLTMLFPVRGGNHAGWVYFAKRRRANKAATSKPSIRGNFNIQQNDIRP